MGLAVGRLLFVDDLLVLVNDGLLPALDQEERFPRALNVGIHDLGSDGTRHGIGGASGVQGHATRFQLFNLSPSASGSGRLMT